ncbi:hypothetical protein [Streptomyces sp. AS58]|uniref:hypothetical protein n=1 Tax=Streptomyces sp. AS58 TaxID=1519489 RepID=UPI0006AE4836|nr:hypothetical protein [Streptomyces sp. AS58]
MNVEELVRHSLREQAAEQRPADPRFADRVLAVRRRRRTRRLASLAGAAAVAVAVAVGVPLLDSGDEQVRPAGRPAGSGTSAHPDQSPPRDLIAAGDTALAAYYTTEVVARTEVRGVEERAYWLLDPATGRYEKDGRWSFVAVAPGLGTAAVLERALPARRIGLLDLATGEVERWIPAPQGAGGLAFSDDGRQLIATTYDENPDLRDRAAGAGGGSDWISRFGRSSRTGFLVADVRGGGAGWSAVPATLDINARQDFAFSHDARLVYTQFIGGRDGLQRFYDLTGERVAAPVDERHLRSDVTARLSPDGRLAALGLTAERKDASYSAILDPRSGKEVARVRGAELLAWADDRRLIAWERTPGSEPYRPRLVLVTVGSERVVPLSGVNAQGPSGPGRRWWPVFAPR